MKLYRLAVTAATLAAAQLMAVAPAAAQTETVIADQLVLCMQHEEDGARLACFDRLARRATAALEAGTSLGAPVAGVAAARPAQPAAPAATARGPEAVPAAAPEADFGLEKSRAREAARQVDSIRSRVPGLFLGWTGDTVFRLENGQVWKQVESGSFGMRLENPEVEISRGWFGGYFLSVEGLNRRVRVERVE
ncbi:MAG TPA: hypothetical protein PLI48_08020 [Gammaproteobacteria bacterium]|nr:hypothetical protein [Gammaproteobacteria bacterium]HRP87081.1 hypothetical protein [Gammaproteobacteria bacterium]